VTDVNNEGSDIVDEADKGMPLAHEFWPHQYRRQSKQPASQKSQTAPERSRRLATRKLEGRKSGNQAWKLELERGSSEKSGPWALAGSPVTKGGG